MKHAYGKPPARKGSFGSTKDEMEYLLEQVVYWIWKPNLARARPFAERLAKLIREPNNENVERYSEEWVAIWEARGDVTEAIRCADITIKKERDRWARLDDRDFKTAWFRGDVRSVEDALFLQADRHLRLGDREKATERMIESAELSKMYRVPLDVDGQKLLRKLAPGHEVYGKPPARKRSFSSKRDKMDYLFEHLAYWLWKPDLSRARHVAERLAKLLGGPNEQNVRKHCEQWVAIWEARGNVEEAIRCCDIMINEEKEILAGHEDADFSAAWFRDDVRFVQEALFLQADRHRRLGDYKKAKDSMREAAELSIKYGVGLDTL